MCNIDAMGILTICSFIISVVSVIVAVCTLFYMHKQKGLIIEHNHQLHEKSRRENACRIIADWSHNLRKEESIAKRIVERFDEKQARALHNEEEFSITKDLYDKLVVILEEAGGQNEPASNSNKQPDNQNRCCEDCYQKNMVKLNKKQVVLLRWYVMHYLNDLECVLLQCKQGIADEEVFIEQFNYQYNTKDGVMALKVFRTIAGGVSSYPATEWFCVKMEERLRKEIIEKQYVDK